MDMNSRKPILCLDFDGVCHSYTSGWRGANVILDDAVPGLCEFLELAKEHFDIYIFSTRSQDPNGILAMKNWFGGRFTEYLFSKDPSLKVTFEAFLCPDYLNFPTKKPAAFVTIDDRAITFTGEWPDIQALLTFKPWNKR